MMVDKDREWGTSKINEATETLDHTINIWVSMYELDDKMPADHLKALRSMIKSSIINVLGRNTITELDNEEFSVVNEPDLAEVG